MKQDSYRGWLISHDPPPIPDRRHDWQATDPDTDGETVTAATYDELLAEIDERIAENGQFGVGA